MSEILELYETQPELLLYGLLACAATTLFLSLFIWFWIKTATRRRIKVAIREMGGQAVENISLSDGVESAVHIDFCIYSKGYVFVFNIQDYPGIIFGGESIELWTQLFEGKSYKFANPIYYNQLCTQVVRELLPGIPVIGRVVFTHHGEFPKGKPEGVCELNQLVGEAFSGLSNLTQNEKHSNTWQEFVQDLSQNKQTRIYKMQPLAN